LQSQPLRVRLPLAARLAAKHDAEAVASRDIAEI